MDEVLEFKKNERVPEWIFEGELYFGTDVVVIKKSVGHVIVKGDFDPIKERLIDVKNLIGQSCKSFYGINTRNEKPYSLSSILVKY
ncbi:hypothetical protein AWH56_009105 [Anaerobacillus isosaccharinicus]|uniref:Uncharacterized protein n=1 Tax=Anaerobacillus isosaccharinicus TaxID=1532552 RepID=A0A1S2LW45_9BACI|nr:hypothetical protein [Anaerobacillus isosaccharinicus]MBA5588910.1 hypothetical protein [Anaerobacillus isosaccharinicus]QOY37720.1 hypothetical protein AWH56_009105 [Anaerobacillus isosaccharinicus]